MEWVFIAIFVFVLIFLQIIYGDRLSLLGIASDQWLRAPLDLVVWFWGLTCQLADRIWCFVVDHFWWVTATASGGIGLLLIAALFAAGIANQAEANRQIVDAAIPAGGALDHTTVLRTGAIRQVSATNDEADINPLVYQVPGSTLPRFFYPESRDVIADFGAQKQVEDVPPLETTSPIFTPAPDYSNSRLRISLRSFLERTGRPVRSQMTERLIQDALFNLRRDDWQAFSWTAARDRQNEDPSFQSPLPEDPQWKVDELAEGVRIVPGPSVAAQDLQIEKSAPAEISDGEFELQIRVINRSPDQLDGLIVREQLPQAWRVLQMEPVGAYRNSVATWLIRGLQPFEEATLRLVVNSEERGPFQSYTEVSATAAVSSPVNVRNARPAPRDPNPPREERPLPPVERLPQVELRLSRPPAVVQVGADADVYFSVRNVGDAPAEGVSLRVNVPFGLDHHDLDPNDADRQVDARIRTLDVGERRQVRLTVQPTRAGRHFPTAELRLQNTQLDIREFQINAVEAEESTPPPPAPQPETGLPSRGGSPGSF